MKLICKMRTVSVEIKLYFNTFCIFLIRKKCAFIYYPFYYNNIPKGGKVLGCLGWFPISFP